MKKYFIVSLIQNYFTGGWAFVDKTIEIDGEFFKRNDFKKIIKEENPNVDTIVITSITPLTENQFKIYIDKN